MRERDLEGALTRAVRDAGGWALKLVSPGTAGVPDRLILTPGGRACFAELKAPGKEPRPLQLVVHKRLRSLGFAVFLVDSAAGIEEVEAWIQA